MSNPEITTYEDQETFVLSCYERAERLRKKKAYSEGIQLLVEALKYGIHKEKLYYRLGNLYIDAGDLGRAEYAYKRALETDPNHANAMHNLSVVYKRQKKISLFVKTYKKSQKMALRHPPKGALNPEQKKRARHLGRRVILLLILGIGVFSLILYLLLRKG
jgi:tetratricopeptide (TPR) repeat protein